MNTHCPYCGHSEIQLHSTTYTGKPCYQCLSCQEIFVEIQQDVPPNNRLANLNSLNQFHRQVSPFSPLSPHPVAPPHSRLLLGWKQALQQVAQIWGAIGQSPGFLATTPVFQTIQLTLQWLIWAAILGCTGLRLGLARWMFRAQLPAWESHWQKAQKRFQAIHFQLQQYVSSEVWLFLVLGVVLLSVTEIGDLPHGPALLAKQILQGVPYFSERITYIEMFEWNNRYHLAYPPMLTLVMLPFMAMGGQNLGQGFFNTMLIWGSTILIYRLVSQLRGIERFAPFAAIAYSLGSPNFHSAATSSVWLLMHSEGNFFFLLALYLFHVRKAYFWAGLSFMTAVQVRYIILLGAIVFPLLFWFDPDQSLPQRQRLKAALRPAIWMAIGAVPPVLLTLGFLGWSTGNPFISPYKLAWQQWGIFHEPTFSPIYFWRNLKFYTLSLPQWIPLRPYLRYGLFGQALWTLSPFLLGIFTINWRLPFVWAFAPASLAMFIAYCFYFAFGDSQFGTRYLQDLFPLLIPLAIAGFSHRARWWPYLFYGLLGLAIVLNTYGLYATRCCPEIYNYSISYTYH